MWRTWKPSLPELRIMSSNLSTYTRAALLMHFMFLASKEMLCGDWRGVLVYITVLCSWKTQLTFPQGQCCNQQNCAQTHPGLVLKDSFYLRWMMIWDGWWFLDVSVSELDSWLHSQIPRYLSRAKSSQDEKLRQDQDQCLSVQDTVFTLENLISIDCKTPFKGTLCNC